MIDVLIGAGAFYLVVAAIGTLFSLAMFAFVFTSITGTFKDFDRRF